MLGEYYAAWCRRGGIWTVSGPSNANLEGHTATAQDYIQRRGANLVEYAGMGVGSYAADLAIWAIEHLGHEDWIFREAARMLEGIYKTLPSSLQNLKAIPGHFLHMSKKRPGQVAFTPSAEYGEQDRQVTLPLSKYLTRYQTELGLDGPKMNELIRSWGARESPVRLYLARTQEDIIYAYTYGPESCMKHDAELTHDPVRVYAGPDTGVLVMIQGGTEGELEGATVLGRAVCHVERKQYVSAYTSDGFWKDQFELLLTAEGWEHSSSCLGGARLLRIWEDECAGKLVMPYIDGSRDCGTLFSDETGDYVMLGSEGFGCCDSTGYIDVEEEDDDREPCERCGDYHDEDDMTYIGDVGYVCNICLNEHYRYAYVGRYQEYVPSDEVYGEDADGEKYTSEGADYHDMVFAEDSPDTLQNRDNLHRTEDGNYYEDIENAENDGYVYTVDEKLIEERFAHRTHTEALDGKWVPDDEVGDYGYVMAEDGAVMPITDMAEHGYMFIPAKDPDDDDLLVAECDLADYGYKIGASGQLESLGQGELEILGYPPVPEPQHLPQAA